MTKLRLDSHFIFKSLYENHPDGIFMLSADEEYLDCNPAFERLTGYGREEFKQQAFLHLVVPDRRAMTREHVRKALQGHSQVFENRMLRKDGLIIEVEVTLIPIYMDGEVAGLYGIDRNITLRKREEQELKAMRDTFSLIAENSSDVIAYTAPDGTLQYVSPAIRTLLGYEPGELVGTMGTEQYHPDDVRNIHSRPMDEQQLYTHRILHKDGHYRWFETLAKKIRNPAGEVIKVLAIGRDITERKMVMDDLRESEQRFRMAFENAPIGMAVVSVTGHWLKVNKAMCAITGYEERELVRLDFHAITHPDDKDLDQEQVQQVLDGQRDSYTLDKRYIRKNGQIIWVQLTATLIRDKRGRPLYFISQIKDMTERKQLGEVQKERESLLRRADKLSTVGQMIASIAHEIRNPLTSIRGFLQMLRPKGGREATYFNVMLEELDRANGIITDFLTLSKTRELELRPHSLNEIIESLYPMLEADGNMKGHQILACLEPARATLLLDEREMKQLILNLVRNSMEAMDTPGRVFLKTFSTHGQAYLEVTDTGCGIPPDKLPVIMEPFVTMKENGTGLGLPVCQSIVEKHGGRLFIESEVGQGTTVRVVLPEVAMGSDGSGAAYSLGESLGPIQTAAETAETSYAAVPPAQTSPESVADSSKPAQPSGGKPPASCTCSADG